VGLCRKQAIRRSKKTNAEEFFGLARTATSPFMRAYYEAVALRYFSSQGELRCPENAKAMQAAFESVCRTLGVGASNRYTEDIVAASVMHFAKAGICDADELSLAVLKDFKFFE
jgi:hypothetical protein